MGVKEELFSFHGVIVTILHDIFVLGAVAMLFLGAWVWTGVPPIGGGPAISDDAAIHALITNNPDYDVKLIPRKGK